MKTSLLASALLAAVLPAAALAGPKEDVAAAAKKLSEAEGYSWTTTTEMGGGNGGGGGGGRNFRPGPVEGKTLKSGISLITTKFGDNTVETFTKDGKYVTKRDGAWKTPQEIAAARTDDNAGGGNGGGRGRGGFGGGMFRNLKSPAEQAAETASKVEKFDEKDGALTGTLSPEAVKGLLTFGGGRRPGGGGGGDGGNRPEPKDTSGTVTYWLKDGAIAKVETHVKGTISANGEDRQIDRKTTTEFSAVGSTKLEVPEEVTKKLAEAKAPE